MYSYIFARVEECAWHWDYKESHTRCACPGVLTAAWYGHFLYRGTICSFLYKYFPRVSLSCTLERHGGSLALSSWTVLGSQGLWIDNRDSYSIFLCGFLSSSYTYTLVQIPETSLLSNKMGLSHLFPMTIWLALSCAKHNFVQKQIYLSLVINFGVQIE